MPTALAIAGRPIGPDHPPLVIAELSGNHNASLERAIRLIDVAADSGAGAVKLQTYSPETITLDHDGPDFRIESGLWRGRTLYDLYREAQTPFEWHEPLFAHARERGLMVFSSPFDETAIALLEGLEAPAYKIASFEAVDLPLIRRAARAGKPMIVSTGMTDEAEIAEALEAAGGPARTILLHCVSAYPARFADANLRAIPMMRERFGCHVGLSDHTPGTAAAVASVALGAVVVEKHFTLARADGGPDSAFSLEPDELTRLVQDCRNAWEALGEAALKRGETEMGNRQFRRSLYVVRDVAAGQTITDGDVRSIRPGFGLAPKRLPEVVGMTAARSLKRGEALDWSMLAPADHRLKQLRPVRG